MPRTSEIREALTELQAFARQMGFAETALGLTAALAQLPPIGRHADRGEDGLRKRGPDC